MIYQDVCVEEIDLDLGKEDTLPQEHDWVLVFRHGAGAYSTCRIGSQWDGLLGDMQNGDQWCSGHEVFDVNGNH